MAELVEYATAAEARKACPPGHRVVLVADQARVVGSRVQVGEGGAYYIVMPPQVNDYTDFIEWQSRGKVPA